ncbi:hypothetical protein EYY60_16100 [Flavobacterium zhairuonense]|uniref:hypothetical protein n=1 Tax=Flavobacterium zhairuonense TaxID=2493631 RepID=UPI00105329DF|nr:hypothetical protein [Flavobacterium zhairuonense]KAF2508649.1 hypothetical protein EYY60_16100 [Flavobacterium zhairuonense]
MSFHFSIKNKNKISFHQLLENKYLPKETKVSFGVNLNDIVNGYSKFYLPKLSSRGVALTTNSEKYDIEINVGATKDDYLLATKITLALAELNDSLIDPEFDSELNLTEFEKKYNSDWIESVKHLGIDSFIQMIHEGEDVVLAFMGPIRHYYVGKYIIDKLSTDSASQEKLNDQLIEEVRKIQYLEDSEEGIEFPSVKIMDFPEEGEKELTVILPNFKVLLNNVDYVVLNKVGEILIKVSYLEFVNYISPKAKRVDEKQYIIYPINEEDYLKMILHFKAIENEKTNTVKFEVKPEVKTQIIKKEDSKKLKWWQIWK